MVAAGNNTFTICGIAESRAAQLHASMCHTRMRKPKWPTAALHIWCNGFLGLSLGRHKNANKSSYGFNFLGDKACCAKQ